MSKSISQIDWLKERQKGIGGSDVAAILGMSPWRTPYQVWEEKTTPIDETAEEDARIIYALAAAYAAFDAVCYPIMGEAVRCTEGDSAQSSDALQRRASEE